MKCFVFTSLLSVIAAHYLSPNALSRNAAEEYCQIQCNSHLSSFHSTEDYTNGIEITMKNRFIQHLQSNDVWIGLLYDNNTNEYYWRDNSLLDFANNIGQSPWNTNLTNSNKHCTVLSASSDYKFQSKDCNDKHIFLCNSCDLIINKYIIISADNQNYTHANIQCNNHFASTLSSIHNENDYEQAKLLCSLATNGEDKSCWIGLDDIDNEGDYKWIDNTTFDFGNNVSGGIYPWSNDVVDGDWIKQPNAHMHDINIDCVDLWQNEKYNINNFNFNDDDCAIQQAFICNLPSTICNHEHWNKISGFWVFDVLCNLYNYKHIDSEKVSVILMDVIENDWKHNIVIDYMFKLFDIEISGGMAGIMMHFDQDYTFYVAFSVSSNGGGRYYCDLILFYNESITLDSVNMIDIYDTNRFYLLKIEIRENVMQIYVNNILYVEYALDLLDLPTNHVLHRFGIKNNRLSVHAKSLYISGSVSTFQNDSIPNVNTTKIPIVSSTMMLTTTNTAITTSNDDLSTTNLLQTISTETETETETETRQTVAITDSNNETNNSHNKQHLITLSVKDFILLLVGLIASVLFCCCAVCFCVLYIKKLILSASFKQHMREFNGKDSKISHVANHSSVDISLGTDNILQKDANIELKITEVEDNDENNLKNEIRKISNSSALYEDYVTKGRKGSQIINILNIPLPKSPVCGESMNEGYDRKNNIHTPTLSVSDLFGSQFQKKSEKSVFLNVAKHETVGYWSSGNEILEVEDVDDDSVNDDNGEKDGNPTKLSIYV